MEQVGTPFEIYNFPATAFVASFVGTLNVVEAGVVDAGAGRSPSPARRSAPRGPSRAPRRATGSRSRCDPRGSTSATGPEGPQPAPRPRSRTSTSSARSCASAWPRRRVGRAAPTTLALDTFNEPHLTLPAVGRAGHRLVPARGVLRPRGDRRPHHAGAGGRGGRRDGVTAPLDGIDLVVFDKDGTLIDFHAMWGGWARDLAAGLEAATGRDLRAPLYRNLGLRRREGSGGRARPAGGDADGPHPRLDDGGPARGGDRPRRRPGGAPGRVARPDPVELAVPLTDLRPSSGRCGPPVADWRWRPRTTAVPRAARSKRRRAGFLDAIACADDGLPVKPAPDMVLAICDRVGIAPARTAVVGDSVADLAMGRAAGAGRCIGVLTGVGTAADLAPHADVTLGSIAELPRTGRRRTTTARRHEHDHDRSRPANRDHPRRHRGDAAGPHRRHLGQARVPQPVRLGEGADRPLHDRARRARGATPPRRHDRRGIEREHGQRDEHGRSGEGLPDDRRHARGDEPGAAGHQPRVRRGGPDHRRLPRHAGARAGPRARGAGPATSARSSSIPSGTSTRTASGSDRSCSASSRTGSCRTPSSRAWAPAGR